MTTIFIWPRVALVSVKVHLLVYFGDDKVARMFVALVIAEMDFRPVFYLIKLLLSACSNGTFCWVNVGNREFHQILFQMKCFVGNHNASVCLVFISVDGVHWLDFPIGVILEKKCPKTRWGIKGSFHFSRQEFHKDAWRRDVDVVVCKESIQAKVSTLNGVDLHSNPLNDELFDAEFVNKQVLGFVSG